MVFFQLSKKVQFAEYGQNSIAAPETVGGFLAEGQRITRMMDRCCSWLPVIPANQLMAQVAVSGGASGLEVCLYQDLGSQLEFGK